MSYINKKIIDYLKNLNLAKVRIIYNTSARGFEFLISKDIILIYYFHSKELKNKISYILS